MSVPATEDLVSHLTLDAWCEAGNCGVSGWAGEMLCSEFRCNRRQLGQRTLAELFSVSVDAPSGVGNYLAASFGRWIDDGRYVPPILS